SCLCRLVNLHQERGAELRVVRAAMTREIRPLRPDDLSDLSRFLTEGFHTPPDADFAAFDVLRWKYLPPETSLGQSGSCEDARFGFRSTPDPTPAERSDAEEGLVGPRSYVARDEAARMVGHLGLCRTAFEGRALAGAGGSVPTIHIIDWLGSPGHRAVGLSLMRQAHQEVATQFGLGVSQAALLVGERAGYE